MRPQYDVVILGSGYGGGVAASRLARTGKRVCLLERGEERWPGEYPHTLKTALQEYHFEDKRPGKSSSLGKASALFQTCQGEGQYVFSGCGLGGTSLVNAGVFLQADNRIFEGPEWPVEIRENSGDLRLYFEKGERMFQPCPYSENMPTPRKLSVFEEQFNSLDLSDTLYRPPLTTRFETGINSVGVNMKRSTGSGNECTGVNDGSKNSVLTTYLADAWTWGAEIFCGVEVTHLRKLDDDEGYVVYYNLIDDQLERKRLMWVRAKEFVVLGAGALGTTEILLRSRSCGLSTSPLLGHRLSSNGDMLAFAYNCDRDIYSIGREQSSSLSTSCGPTISACLDLRRTEEASDVRDGFVIQEGAVPEALSPVIQTMLESRIRFSWPLRKESISKGIARMKSCVFGPHCEGGSVNRTAVYLVMSHDENEGTLEMKKGSTVLRWSGAGHERRNQRIQKLLSSAAASIGGTLIDTPCMTVHPLGGACMSNDGTGSGGVVNHMGQVYCGLRQEVHKGLICVDASIMPTSLALAERCCDFVLRERKWSVDERSNQPLDFNAKPYRSLPSSLDLDYREEQLRLNNICNGLRFDETMHGWLQATKEDCDFEAAARVAKSVSSYARLSVAVSLNRSANAAYKGAATGMLSYSALSNDPLMITQGSVDLLTVDPDISDAVNLIYDLKLISTDGKTYIFRGYKTVDPSIAFSIPRTWTATTTLLTTISMPDGTQVAKGVLRISLKDVFIQLLSLRCNAEVKFMQRLCSKMHFLCFFARRLIPYMLGPFRPLQYHDDITYTDIGHKLKPKPVETWISSADGVQICIKVWEPTQPNLVAKTPVVLIPGASVDDQIFSLPTISTNTIDYLTSQGHRCYVPILRFGIGNEAKNGWTVFDARLDVKAALQYIRNQEKNMPIYAIVHCLGSIATATALLNGDVDPSWLSGLACSQVFTDLIYSKDNDFKAKNQVLIELYKKLAGDWFSCRSPSTGPWIQILLDQILRFYPTGSRKEICNSAVCHRCDLPFGRCWSHANLNHATHARLGELFDGIHMNFLSHLSRMGAASSNHIRTNIPEFVDLVTPANMRRFSGLKICFLSGGDNAVWLPAATKKSFDMFRQTFPHGDYERFVLPGYGHLDCWMGKNAHKDVYPRITHHIQSCEQALSNLADND
ncbi:glucose-methanol-choline oxidoreductase [Stagonosporopsis vannaccii]|nr:glucose-methanol-choline oxidoreductase [Stagonosporopsis vannaccii]